MKFRARIQNQVKGNGIAAVVLAGLLLVGYANSFHASWQYDDFGNIVENQKVHLTHWSWEQFKAALSAGLDHQTISRPLAYLSFALNHGLGGLEPFGYHLFNFCVHWLSAFLLYLFLSELLCLDVFQGRYCSQARRTALIAASLWATHPIHVTAVTFIVQRMASMAGCFYIGGMLFYLKGRQAEPRRLKLLYFGLAGLSAICALLTKENTVMLFYALILLEFAVLQSNRPHRIRRCLIWIGLVTGLTGALAFLYTDPLQLFRPFEIRPFTWAERLLTQPRVIWLYVALIAVPMTSKMTLLHDIEISRSLFAPWNTWLAALSLALILVVLVIFVFSRKHVLLAYCGLFFIMNHAIEASFLNLELVYEHRNYIPTMLVFVPVGLAVQKAFDLFQYRPSFQWMISGTLALVLASQCYTTYAYNRVFQTEHALWTHITRRAPRLSVGYNNLGNIYWNSGQWDQAYIEFSRALGSDRYFNIRHKGLVYHNLGLYYLNHTRQYGKALVHFETADRLYPDNLQIRYQLARTRLALGDHSAAAQILSKALLLWPGSAGVHQLNGLMHLKSGRCEQARISAQRALSIDSNHATALTVLAEAHRCTGDRAAAIRHWEAFIQLEPNNITALIALIELNHTGSLPELAMSYIQQLADVSGGRSLDELLDTAELWTPLNAVSIDKDRVRRVIKELVANTQHRLHTGAP